MTLTSRTVVSIHKADGQQAEEGTKAYDESISGPL